MRPGTADVDGYKAAVKPPDRAKTLEHDSDNPTVSPSVALGNCFDLLRPSQWIKNVVVFAGPAAALKLSSAASFAQALIAFVAFCLVASAAYALNDVLDREADSNHPTKQNRPVASGAIRPSVAVILACALAVVSFATATLLLNPRVTVVLMLYFALTLAYSAALKERVILDVIIVAIGFVLRAWAGSLAVGVETSSWLIACVFTLCLFVGFGKRRCELAMIPDINEAGQHRLTLLRYTPDLLNHLITVSAGIAVITFLLYTMDTGAHPAPFHKDHLFYTLPLVVYGIFRYAMVTELGVYSGPTEIILRDRALASTIILWATITLLIAYQVALFGPGGLGGIFSPG